MAIRTAVTLDLHMRSNQTSPTAADTCAQGRLWWAIYSLDCTVARMIGRTSAFDHRICTVPLPTLLDNSRPSRSSKVEEERRKRQQAGPEAIGIIANTMQHAVSNLGSAVDNQAYFCCHKLLNTLGQEAIAEIYKPIQQVHLHGRLLETIETFNQRLDKWRLGLPGIFEFQASHEDHQVLQKRLCLGAAFYSTRIIINRPCLCIRELSPVTSRNAGTVRKIASTCVQAAKNMLKLFSLQPVDESPYLCVPFWSFEHYLVQSISVITIELLRPEYVPRQNDEGLPLCKEAVLWLHKVARRNQVASRALIPADEMLRQAALRIGAYIDNTPMTVSSKDPELEPAVEESGQQGDAATDGKFRSSDLHGIMPPQMYAMFDDFQALDAFEGSIPLGRGGQTTTAAENGVLYAPGVWADGNC